MSNGAFPDPIHTLKECSLKYNTFTEMNFNRFDFSDGISRAWNFTKRSFTSNDTRTKADFRMLPVIKVGHFWARHFWEDPKSFPSRKR